MKKNNLCSAIAAVTLLSVSGVASATNGTLTFDGSVESTTCQVTGMNGTAVIPSVDRAAMQEMAHDAYASHASVAIEVTDCPSEISRANLQVQFATIGGSQSRVNLGETDMRGAWVYLHRDPQDNNSGILNNTTIPISLTQGAGSFTFHPTLRRSTFGSTGAETVIPGSFSAPVTLTMTYE